MLFVEITQSAVLHIHNYKINNLQTNNMQFRIQIKQTFNSTIEYPFSRGAIRGWLVGLPPFILRRGVVTRKTFPYFELILEKELLFFMVEFQVKILL